MSIVEASKNVDGHRSINIQSICIFIYILELYFPPLHAPVYTDLPSLRPLPELPIAQKIVNGNKRARTTRIRYSSIT